MSEKDSRLRRYYHDCLPHLCDDLKTSTVGDWIWESDLDLEWAFMVVKRLKKKYGEDKVCLNKVDERQDEWQQNWKIILYE